MYKIIPMVSSKTPENSIVTKNGKFAFVFDSEKEKNQATDIMFQSLFVGAFVAQNAINNLHLSLSEVLACIEESEKESSIEIPVKKSKRKEYLNSATETLSNVFYLTNFSTEYFFLLGLDRENVKSFSEKVKMETKPVINIIDQFQLKKIEFKEFELVSYCNYDNCKQFDIDSESYIASKEKHRVSRPSYDSYFPNLNNVVASILTAPYVSVSNSPSFHFSLIDFLTEEQIELYKTVKLTVDKFSILSEKIRFYFDDYHLDYLYSSDFTKLKSDILGFIEEIKNLTNH